MALTHRASLQRVLVPALAAGILTGAVITVLQQVFLVPLILQAEVIEAGAHAHQAAALTLHAGLDRIAYTLLFNCLGSFGYALLLAGCYVLLGPVAWQRGLLWGLAGFGSFSLAPALGLPPELPGAHAADIVSRQLWWTLTALATAGALACILLARAWLVKCLGAGLVLLPHLIGAPQSFHINSAVPAEMSRAFALGSLSISLTLWLLLGSLTAALMTRLTIRPARNMDIRVSD